MIVYIIMASTGPEEAFFLRILSVFAVLVSVLAGHSSPAFAWGCVAEAEDGASGWSNNYQSVRDARRRAVSECEANTSDTCEITDCNQDW